MKKYIYNSPEKAYIAELLATFYKPTDVSTIEWARTRRIISKTETSYGIGYFDPLLTPYMEYVYDCLDNRRIPRIVSMKAARIGWTEVLNNYRGKRIEVDPTSMLLAFPTQGAARNFAKRKWVYFLDGVEVLRGLVNKDVAKIKRSQLEFKFPGGDLRFVTLGSITNQKSDNIPYIEIEEPDDARDDVSGQGDTFANLSERQRTVPTTQRKFIFGGTPTFKDFSRVEAAMKYSNYMVFKAECHNCKTLVRLDGEGFDNLKLQEWGNNFYHEQYGNLDPYSVKFICPNCKIEWTFEQKNLNIIAGKKHGFTDFTGKFSKGWHQTKPENTDAFGFAFSELLSPLGTYNPETRNSSESHFVEIAKAYAEATNDLLKNRELKMKSFFNNKKGLPYANGISAMESDEMVKYRRNYPDNLVHSSAVVMFMGVDVQDNRFAIIKRAYDRYGNSWRVDWKEIFGNVTNPSDSVWLELKNEIIKPLPHASGKDIYVTGCSIDSADNSELVYRFVLDMLEYTGVRVLACRGVRELRQSEDEIYKEPVNIDITSDPKRRKSMAERMGVHLYHVGTHKAHEEILRKIGLTKLAYLEELQTGSNTSYTRDLFYWNEGLYGNYEVQMTSCRKLLTYNRVGKMTSIYKLIPGKRKEAMDAEKLSLHAYYAAGVQNYTSATWTALENSFTN